MSGQNKKSSHEVLSRAQREARRLENFSRGGFTFLAQWNHIIESQCDHAEISSTCGKCQFSQLQLPEIPEMVFPYNKLVIAFASNPESYIEFNALDALRQVCHDRLPNVQVAPSTIWQEARKTMGFGPSSHPFDWTFTTKYNGTVVGCQSVPADQPIDMERLKQQDEIGFYAQVTLFEDELADHGCAQLSARIRVMPEYFFVLMRFYLRVDHVLIRVCDTRLVGDNGSGSITREWSLREAKIADLKHVSPEVLLDGNTIWPSLPIVESSADKLIPVDYRS